MKKTKENKCQHSSRRGLLLVSLMVLMVFLMAVPAAAMTDYHATGTVVNIKTTLSVRKKASAGAESIGALKNGAKVTITGRSTNWYRIDFDHEKAFVSRTYIKVGAVNNGSQENTSSVSGKKGYVFNAASLNVREKASSTASVIGSLEDGTSVTILGSSGGWYKIKYGSRTGYVSKDFIKLGTGPSGEKEKPSSSTKPASPKSMKEVNMNGRVVTDGSSLNIRKTASKTAAVIGKAEAGSRLHISGQSAEWYRIALGSSTGYVMRAYVDAKVLKSAIVSYSAKGYVYHASSLNVRKKNTSSGSVLGSLKEYSSVIITGESADWYRIRYNASFGYVKKEYIKLGQSPKKPESDKDTSVANKTGVVNVDSTLNVRSSASMNASVIGSLRNGAAVQLQAVVGEFYQIKYGSGKGYVRKGYIDIKSGSTNAKVEPEKETRPVVKALSKTVYADVVTSLLVRSSYSNSAAILGRLYRGAKITVTGSISGWYRIRYNGKTGYVKTVYTSSRAPKPLAEEKPITYFKSISLHVPLYHQYDSRWANVAIGSTTLKRAGCVTASLAMCTEYLTGATCTPPMMVKKLKYDSDGSVFWPGNVYFYSDDNFLSVIYKSLANKKPVIVSARYPSGGYHYVTIYGYDGSTSSLSSSGFLVNDPGTGGTKTLRAFFDRTGPMGKLVLFK